MHAPHFSCAGPCHGDIQLRQLYCCTAINRAALHWVYLHMYRSSTILTMHTNIVIVIERLHMYLHVRTYIILSPIATHFGHSHKKIINGVLFLALFNRTSFMNNCLFFYQKFLKIERVATYHTKTATKNY